MEVLLSVGHKLCVFCGCFPVLVMALLMKDLFYFMCKKLFLSSLLFLWVIREWSLQQHIKILDCLQSGMEHWSGSFPPGPEHMP